MASGLDIGHLWPSDNPRYMIAKKTKAMPVPPKIGEGDHGFCRLSLKVKRLSGIRSPYLS
jgi:hypothetical protein